YLLFEQVSFECRYLIISFSHKSKEFFMSDQTSVDNQTIDNKNPELKKHSFEAEVAQLLHLVTHSLYSNSDIFVRELVSNASDACDKLRFEATNDDSLYEDDGELRIRIAVDEA